MSTGRRAAACSPRPGLPESPYSDAFFSSSEVQITVSDGV